jgi:hypothetical protein
MPNDRGDVPLDGAEGHVFYAYGFLSLVDRINVAFTASSDSMRSFRYINTWQELIPWSSINY